MVVYIECMLYTDDIYTHIYHIILQKCSFCFSAIFCCPRSMCFMNVNLFYLIKNITNHLWKTFRYSSLILSKKVPQSFRINAIFQTANTFCSWFLNLTFFFFLSLSLCFISSSKNVISSVCLTATLKLLTLKWILSKWLMNNSYNITATYQRINTYEWFYTERNWNDFKWLLRTSLWCMCQFSKIHKSNHFASYRGANIRGKVISHYQVKNNFLR